MDKIYNPKEIESKHYKAWEDDGHFSAKIDSEQSKNNSYCIMLPPPNVTGILHMGHAFQQTIMDCLIRHNNMIGKNTLWQPGTDHAGIATQMVVERLLQQEGTSRIELGREKFLERVWQWKEQSADTITEQMKRLGVSCDWSRTCFTMDEKRCAAVTHAFVELYKDKKIYRGKRLVNWDPKLHTAISDLEVENREKKGKMWYLRYPLIDAVTQAGNSYIIVATTRPETMLGDSGIAVNPKDERYKHLIGKEVLLPLLNRPILIVADDHADMEKGTGCVKITPAHDFNDFEVGKRHDLPLINIFNKDAAILSETQAFNQRGEQLEGYTVPEQYVGLDRFAARKAILAQLEVLDLVEAIEENEMTIPYGDRSGVVIEPYLTDQWYVDAKTLSQDAIKAVEDGSIEFVPEQYKNMYFSWMRDIQDWCISRQLWWGHRIPVWYKGDEIHCGEEAPQGEGWIQDEDVLDAWFSSALWTFSTLDWPKETKELELFHPTDVLVTGFDIIFFWVARMIMMSLYFKKEVPFKQVYVTGLIRDDEGQKMSKSKGNVIDPLDMIDGISLPSLIEKNAKGLMQPEMKKKVDKQLTKRFPSGIEPHGTDALRFTLLSLASSGRDINWDMDRLKGYRNFCNKLWNAARYVLEVAPENIEKDQALMDITHQAYKRNQPRNILQNEIVGLSRQDKYTYLSELWLIHRCQNTFGNIKGAIENYRFDKATDLLYHFLWDDYCSWYIEFNKVTLNLPNISAEEKNITRKCLRIVLRDTLKLLHPMMPFITEEIWQQLYPNTSITQQKIPPWRAGEHEYVDLSKDQSEDIIDIIEKIRETSGKLHIAPNTTISLLVKTTSPAIHGLVEAATPYIKALARADNITWLTGDQKAPDNSAKGHVRLQYVDYDLPQENRVYNPEFAFAIPLDGLIDNNVEVARLKKEIDKLDKGLERTRGKVSNPKFLENAAPEIVEKEKERLEIGENELALICEKLKSLKA